MQFIYDNKIIENPLHSLNEVGTFELLKRLVKKIHNTPFNVLKNEDWIRSFAIKKYKLISDYIHLVDQE